MKTYMYFVIWKFIKCTNKKILLNYKRKYRQRAEAQTQPPLNVMREVQMQTFRHLNNIPLSMPAPAAAAPVPVIQGTKLDKSELSNLTYNKKK